MVYLRKEELASLGFSSSVNVSTPEDVATLLDIYERCLESHKPEDIAGFAELDGHYVCIVDDSAPQDFDLFMCLASKYNHAGGVVVNCANARFLFPKELSRGEYEEEDLLHEEPTSDFSDETATGFWDDEGNIAKPHCLKHTSSGDEIPIEDEDGVIFGRSSSRAGYVVGSDGDLISRLHARVYLENGKYMVEDLGSKNGTFINRVKVMAGKDREIKVGDTLRLANEEFKFL